MVMVVMIRLTVSRLTLAELCLVVSIEIFSWGLFKLRLELRRVVRFDSWTNKSKQTSEIGQLGKESNWQRFASWSRLQSLKALNAIRKFSEILAQACFYAIGGIKQSSSQGCSVRRALSSAGWTLSCLRELLRGLNTCSWNRTAPPIQRIIVDGPRAVLQYLKEIKRERKKIKIKLEMRRRRNGRSGSFLCAFCRA